MAVGAIALAGLAISAVGVGASIYGQIKQTQSMSAAEAARQKQMNLEASREKRDVIRNSILARATALFNASSQGAQYGSGLPGGYGQISGRAGNQTLAVNQNQGVGNELFAANRAYYSASGITGFGSGLSSLGGALVSNAGTISRLGTYFGGGTGGVMASGDPIPIPRPKPI